MTLLPCGGRSATRRRALALSFALAAAASAFATATTWTASARAAEPDRERQTIDWFIAHDRSREALPLAQDRARRLRFDLDAWREVLKLAGWNSVTDAAVEALENIVFLRHDDREARFQLAQRFLWQNRTKDALPHVEWLLENGETDPVALEVCLWVASAEGDTSLAYDAASRWLAVAKDEDTRIRARWALADLTHWSVRWREAREQYKTLIGVETQSAKAGERLDLLRHEQPTEARLEGLYYTDNFDNAYVGLAAAAELPIPGRLVLLPRSELGRWSRFDRKDIRVGIEQFRLRWEPWQAVRPEVTLGFEGDTAEHHDGYGSAGSRVVLGGWLFARAIAYYDRLRVGLDSIQQNVRATGALVSAYAEPKPWIFFSGEIDESRISDDNVHSRVFAAVGARTPGTWQVEPRFYVGYDAYRDQRANALPYFTPTNPWAAGWDVTGRADLRLYSLHVHVKPEASIGFIFASGSAAVRPSGGIHVDAGESLRFAVIGTIVGTPQYRQERLDASIGWLF